MGSICLSEVRVTKKQTVLHVEVEVENESDVNSIVTVNNELIDTEGNTVARKSGKLSIQSGLSEKIRSDLKVNAPRLWDIDHPNLYQLKTTCSKNGEIIVKQWPKPVYDLSLSTLIEDSHSMATG